MNRSRKSEVPPVLNVLDWSLFLVQVALIVYILYQLRFILGPSYYAARAEELVLFLAVFCFLTASNICISLLAKSYLDEPRYRESKLSPEV